MKILNLKDVPITLAHGNLKRQRFIGPGELKSNIQTVNIAELNFGESFTPHSHSDCEECFFVLDGTADATISNKKFKIKKGDFLIVEPGEEHVFRNNSKRVFTYFAFRVLI